MLGTEDEIVFCDGRIVATDPDDGAVLTVGGVTGGTSLYGDQGAGSGGVGFGVTGNKFGVDASGGIGDGWETLCFNETSRNFGSVTNGAVEVLPSVGV